MRLQPGADGTFPPEGQQQEIARHHRRQDERQMHEGIEHAPPWEASAREQIGHGQAGRQACERRDGRDLQAQLQCGPFLGREGGEHG